MRLATRATQEPALSRLSRSPAPTAGAFALVDTHCEIVWSIAEQLLPAPRLRHLDTDGRLDHAQYIRHGLLPEALRRFCSHHTGVGLTRHDVLSQGLPLPPADYLAVTEDARTGAEACPSARDRPRGSFERTERSVCPVMFVGLR
ncbi:hypothetical protein [Streptomyces sp. NPDC004658]|uniref:hypothetical protein n=1 Tax=Streptomyces sp. NPDC004658 TaxID=3154672 RepID=UPI0033ADED34